MNSFDDCHKCSILESKNRKRLLRINTVIMRMYERQHLKAFKRNKLFNIRGFYGRNDNKYRPAVL